MKRKRTLHVNRLPSIVTKRDVWYHNTGRNTSIRMLAY